MNVTLLIMAARNSRPSASGAGSIALNWVAPATMGDGSAVTGLTGYKVYWSQVPYDINPPNSASVAGAGTLTYTVTGLASGNWYLWVSAVTSGGESPLMPALNETTDLPYWTI